MLVCAALWVPRLTGPLDLRYDAGTYYVLGTSLADGHGYRLSNEPGAIEAIQYPPLLPMIVAAHQWLLGSREPAVVGHALRLTWAGLFFVYAIAAYVLARRVLPSGWALIATLLVILNLQLLWLSDALFAEMPYACATVLFLLVAEDERRGLAGVFGAIAYLLRTSGLALLAAWVVDALWQRRVLEAILRATLAALPILVWQAYVSEVQGRPEFTRPAYTYQRAGYNFYNVSYAANLAYVDAFVPERGLATTRDLVHRVAANALRLPEALGESIGVRAEGPLRPVFVLRDDAPPPASNALAASRFGCALIGLVAACGLGMMFADGFRLGPLVWIASLALVTLTPWSTQQARYLVPLAPLTAIGFVLVLQNASRIASGALQTAAGAAIGILIAGELVVLSAVFGARHQPIAELPGSVAQRLFFYSPRWRIHDEALAWLAATAEPGAVVATATPQRLHLASGLRAVFPPFEPDPNVAERLLRTVPATWVVIDDLEFLDVARRYAEPAVLAHPERWRLVYDGRQGGPAHPVGSRIYRRVGS